MCIDIMEKVVGYFQSIPDVVWSGIVASVLTLSGVILSNRSNTNRLNIQLKHDASEKAKERIAGIRREVYLRGVEEAHKVMRHFINLPNIDLAETNTSEELHGFQSALSKAKLVAEPKTVSLITSLEAECSKIYIGLMLDVQLIQDARTYMSGFNENIELFETKAEKILAELNGQRNSPDAVMENLKSLMAGYEKCSEMIAGHKKQRDIKEQEQDRLVAEFNKTIYTILTPFGKLMGELEIAMRGELGLATDAVEYRAQMELQRLEAGALLDKSLAHMHASNIKPDREEKNG